MISRISLLLCFCFIALTPVFSQIENGVYNDNEEWFVIVRNDTAFAERMGQKKSSVWFFSECFDTLIRQNDNCCKGAKSALQKNGNSILLVRSGGNGRKRVKLPNTSDRALLEWNRKRNFLLMTERNITGRYVGLLKHLEKLPEKRNDAMSSYDELMGRITSSQQLFRETVLVFERKFLAN
jgi:hypothetical protein